MSWFGGFAGGVLAGLAVMQWKRLPKIAVLAAATPALAVGHMIGRIGCFLVGDDYGRPTTLPWAVAFPQGLPPTTVPVHPTQLYEAAALIPLALVLLRLRRRRMPDRVVLGTYLVLAGLLRFAIEFVRINERVLLASRSRTWPHWPPCWSEASCWFLQDAELRRRAHHPFTVGRRCASVRLSPRPSAPPAPQTRLSARSTAVPPRR